MSLPVLPRLVAACLTLALGATACGGSSPTGSSFVASPPPSTPVPATSTPASGEPSAAPDPSSPDAPSTSLPPVAGPFEPARVAVALESVADVPGAPLAIAAPDDGSGRLFVAERGGRIWVVRDGRRSDAAFLDIATRITAGGEMGLLGLALHPDFPTDPRFYIYYSDLDRDQVVAERRLDPADPNRADRDYERLILRMDDFAGNHNGGGLAFGPDGYLYIATGDGGGAGDPQGTGQRLDTPLGKILRIDPTTGTADGDYDVPDDNPFVGRDGALPEIWHTGLRNPFRFSFDRSTGDLWIGDVGQNQWEEIDVARAGQGGLNYGWSVMEGHHCFRDEGCATDGLTLPVTEYTHDLGCSVTGGVVYRGSAWAGLVGAYLFADYCSGRVWAIDAGATEVATPVVVAETEHAISSFGEDPAGEVYVADLNGALLRLVAPAR